LVFGTKTTRTVKIGQKRLDPQHFAQLHTMTHNYTESIDVPTDFRSSENKESPRFLRLAPLCVGQGNAGTHINLGTDVYSASDQTFLQG
jgi:hypothetical protein